METEGELVGSIDGIEVGVDDAIAEGELVGDPVGAEVGANESVTRTTEHAISSTPPIQAMSLNVRINRCQPRPQDNQHKIIWAHERWCSRHSLQVF